jgi:O-antigen/teichoic acid export membrane protein
MFSKITHNSGFRKILNNSGWMMSEQIIRMLVGLFVSVWIARLLGPSQFGELSFAISFASLFGIFAALGLNRIVVRELVKNADSPDFSKVLISTVLGMRLCAAICMFLFCTLVAWFAKQGELILVGIISASFLFSVFDSIDLFFQSRTEARVTAVARTLAFSVVTIVKIALLLAKAGIIAFALVTLFEFFCAALALWLVYRWRGFNINFSKINWRLAGKLMRESWPEIISSFSVILFMKIDQVMLQNMIGSNSVGLFSVAARLSEAWYFIPIAIVASTFPSIVRQREIDLEIYMNRIQQLMSGLVVLSYLAILGTSFLASPVVAFLYGSEYGESAIILVIHIWCGLFVSLGISSGSWIMAEGMIKLNLYRTLFGAVTNLILNFVFIPRYGAVGAAYSTLFSLMAAYLFFDFFVPSMRCMAKAKIRALLLFPLLAKMVR